MRSSPTIFALRYAAPNPRCLALGTPPARSSLGICFRPRWRDAGTLLSSRTREAFASPCVNPPLPLHCVPTNPTSRSLTRPYSSSPRPQRRRPSAHFLDPRDACAIVVSMRSAHSRPSTARVRNFTAHSIPHLAVAETYHATSERAARSYVLRSASPSGWKYLTRSTTDRANRVEDGCLYAFLNRWVNVEKGSVNRSANLAAGLAVDADRRARMPCAARSAVHTGARPCGNEGERQRCMRYSTATIQGPRRHISILN